MCVSQDTITSGAVSRSVDVPMSLLVTWLLGSHEYLLQCIEGWAAQIVVRYGLDAVPEIVNKVKRFGFDEVRIGRPDAASARISSIAATPTSRPLVRTLASLQDFA